MIVMFIMIIMIIGGMIMIIGGMIMITQKLQRKESGQKHIDQYHLGHLCHQYWHNNFDQPKTITNQ